MKLGGALIILNMPVDVRPLRNRRNDIDALSRLELRHLPGQEPHLRERAVERLDAFSRVVIAVAVEPAPLGVALDQIVVALENLDLRSRVGGLPGDGVSEGVKLCGDLPVSNLFVGVRDIDDADVSALVLNFMLFGGDDEQVAFDLRVTFVKVA